MSASGVIPNIGAVVAQVTADAGLTARRRPAKSQAWGGINIEMSPIPGITKPGIFDGATPAHPLGTPYYFQVPPLDSFGEDGSGNYSDYATLSAGQHSQWLGRNLRTCQFTVNLLDWTPPWAVYAEPGYVPDSFKLRRELEAIRDAGAPFLLSAYQPLIRSGYDISYPATLRSLHWETRSGEVDGYYVTVGFTEFTSPQILQYVAAAVNNPHLPASLNTGQLPSDRNTLAKIAKFYYGDPTAWRAIAAANGMRNVSANTVLTVANTGRKKLTVPLQVQQVVSGGHI